VPRADLGAPDVPVPGSPGARGSPGRPAAHLPGRPGAPPSRHPPPGAPPSRHPPPAPRPLRPAAVGPQRPVAQATLLPSGSIRQVITEGIWA